MIISDHMVAFARRARNVRVLAMDFDGVMTDNSVYVFEDGREAVRCSRFEGYGLRRVATCGVFPIILSTEANPVVKARARKLRIASYQNITDKVVSMEAILAEQGASFETTAFIGNDVNDIGLLGRVGLPVIVADAHEDLHALGAFRTRRPGGRGAVRELCDAIAFVLETDRSGVAS